MGERLVADIEANGLLEGITTVWCIGVKNIDTNEYTAYYDKTLDQGIERLNNAEVTIGHNWLGYDKHAIQKVYGMEKYNPQGRIIDTLIISRLVKPDFPGGHSLDAWGRRLGNRKMDFRQACIDAGVIPKDAMKGDEFLQFSDLMLDYMQQDVEVGHHIYRALCAIIAKDVDDSGINWSQSLRCEHRAQDEIAQQFMHGWEFDSARAATLLDNIEKRIDVIDEAVQPYLFIKVQQRGTTVDNPFKKDGTPKKTVIDWFGEDWMNVEGAFNRIEYIKPDLGSRQQVIEQLIKHGWRPTEYTDKGNPKLTEDSAVMAVGAAGKMLCERFICTARRGVVRGWIKHQRFDGRVGADAIAQGAVTGRMTHKVVANVPKANTDKEGHLVYFPEGKVMFGTEMRELFTCPPDRILVGTDASGLELRMLAHYLNDNVFTEMLLEGDIHQEVADALGVSRDDAKTIEYGWLYGAGDAKLGSVVGGDDKVGARFRKKLLKVFKAEKLVQQVELAAKRGWLRGIDGRKIPIRHEHAALNTLLQSAGGIIMKYAWFHALDACRADRLDFKHISHYHDEYTFETIEEQAERVGYHQEQGIIQMGNKFNLNCHLDAKHAVGRSWADIH